MGLMDIGSNNPYAIINPFAAVIDQGMKGWRTTSDRIAAEQKDAASQAQQAQILEFARQDAERKNAAEVTRLQKLAEEAAAKRAYEARTIPQYGFQQGPTEPMQAPMNGLMSAQGSMNPFVDPRLAAMQGPQEAPAPQPVANMGAVPQAPMTQRDMLDFRAQYAGTPTAEAVGQNAAMMGKEVSLSRKAVESVLANPDKYDAKTLQTVSALTGIDLVGKNKATYKQRQYEKGDKIVHEVSNDDGQTWQPLSEAPRYKPASGEGVNGTDKIIAREAVKDIPKLRKEANFANNTIARLDTMIGLIDKGQAAGLSGEIKAFFAPVAGDAVSDADFYKRLSKSNAGALRQTVVGGGAVSNYENQLLQTIGGGGAGAKRATRQLLEFYKSEHKRTIDNYNSAVESAEYSAPGVSRTFKPIGKGSPNPAQGGNGGNLQNDALAELARRRKK